MTKLHFIAVLLCLLLSVTPAKSRVTLGFDGEDAALVGIYIKDLRTGKVIADNDSKKALLPASITKALTAASAVSILPYDFMFTTGVCLTGNRNSDEQGQWDGNLVIDASGDPTIDSGNFSSRTPFAEEIISTLLGMGIKSISGRIIINQPMPDQGCVPQWEIDDVAWAYGAGWYGFNYRDNKFRLWPVSRHTSPYVADLQVFVGKGAQNEMYRGINSNELYVYGPDPANSKWVVTASMPDPAEVFITELYDKCASAGIEIFDMDLPVSTSVTTVCTHRSPKLPDILREMMFDSHNLFAEGMLRAIAPGNTRKDAIEKEKRLWRNKNISVSNNNIVDGSGLSRANRIQPVLLGSVLEAMADNSTYVSLFPKVGKEGTVQNFLTETSLKGRLALKTGSMNSVQCYAGYKLDAEGTPTHVVVIMVNSFFCQRAQLRGAIAKFLVDTFKPKQ